MYTSGNLNRNARAVNAPKKSTGGPRARAELVATAISVLLAAVVATAVAAVLSRLLVL